MTLLTIALMLPIAAVTSALVTLLILRWRDKRVIRDNRLRWD